MNGSATSGRTPGEGDETLSLDQLMDILPHRSPFLMVDRVVERRAGHSCLALKRVSFGDPLIRTGQQTPELSPFFLVEAMSQTAALAAVVPGAAGAGDGEPRVGFLAAVRGFEAVRRPVPGDTLEIRTEVVGRFGMLVKVVGSVSVDGIEIGSAELTLSVPGEVEDR